MPLFHDLKKEGYTVKELAEHLQAAVTAGEGERRVFLGPTIENSAINELADFAKEHGGYCVPLAVPIVGIEVNKEDGGGENDVYWLYPGGDEWI